MSLITYQQATYAVQLRDQLERAGCEAPVAALLSRAVGELIDHVAHAESRIQRDIQDREFRESMRTCDASAARRDLVDRFTAVMFIVLAAALVAGVLIALFR